MSYRFPTKTLRPAFFLLLGLLCVLPTGCQKPGREEVKTQPASEMEAVTICRSSIMHLPLVVAETQGLFAGQGLKVTTKEFVVGRDALEAMLNGECDFASAAEPPIIEYSLQRSDFRILSAMQSSDNLCRIVARTDRGVNTPTDLRGKRIAPVKGTAPHYFLKLFLEKNGIDLKEVSLDFLKGDEMLAAITSGKADAISMTHKVIGQALKTLGDKALLMESPGLCRNYYILMTMSSLLEKRPAVAEKFLRALAQAEKYKKKKPAKAQAIVSADRKLPLAEVKELWEIYDQRLSLDHAMLMGLEDMARWFVQQQQEKSAVRPIPNFMNLIHLDSLRAVRPEAINLEK